MKLELGSYMKYEARKRNNIYDIYIKTEGDYCIGFISDVTKITSDSYTTHLWKNDIIILTIDKRYFKRVD